jgi:hypothetical protein
MTRTRQLLAAGSIALAAALPFTQGVPAHAAHAKPIAPALKSGALAIFAVNGERFKVWVTAPQAIDALKALKNGTGTANIPNGRLLRGPGKGGFNAPWRWHLDPRDIQMADMTTEACDGTPAYVNAHLRTFISTVGRYCPWSAKLMSLTLLGSPVPSAPAALMVQDQTTGTTSAQATTVTLRWRDTSTTEDGFHVTATLTRQHGVDDSQAQDAPANATTAHLSFVAGGINSVTRACFAVSAYNAAGSSPQSNTVCVTL